MSTPSNPTRRLLRLAGLLVAAAGLLAAARWAADAAPAAQGVPPGSVARGQDVYFLRCAYCHGDALEGGGRSPALVGRHTVPDYPNAAVLFEYTRRSMPYDAPGTLSDDDVLSVVAFLLNQNGLFSDDGVLEYAMLEGFVLPGADPISPPLPGAPDAPQEVMPGSGQAGPVIGGGR